MPIAPGVAAPWFRAPTPHNPQFAFDSVAGRFILLAFPPDPEEDGGRAHALLTSLMPHYDDVGLAAFGVEYVPGRYSDPSVHGPLRWFCDADGSLRRLYGAIDASGAAHPHWVLIDPSLRVMSVGGFDEAERLTGLVSSLPQPAEHAGTRLNAPVLIVPRIFEPEICRQLIALYEADGGAPSGIMQDIGGKTVGVLNDFKRRRDASIQDESLRAQLSARISRRLLPEIKKALQFTATRMERYIVACYSAEDGGYFRPHRDNTTFGTAHRQFACSINLNAEAFEGGDLRFPEYGPRTYRPPTGGAVVFSCSLLHEATPVTRGTRYAFLPFFYDEAARAIRDRNLQYLAGAAGAEQPASDGAAPTT